MNEIKIKGSKINGENYLIKSNINLKKVKNKDFKQMIKEAIYKVSSLEKDADKKIIEMLQGKASVHEVMIALQKAEISMKIMLSIRNKLLDAYKEIMHMQF